MQHPFDGIIIPESDQGECRRDALKHLAVGGAAALGLSQAAAADDKVASKRKTINPKDYDRYLVIPRDLRGFYKRRLKLGIGGNYFTLPSKDRRKRVGGYLGWLTKEQAKRIAASKEVKQVRRLTAADISGPGPRRGKTTQLVVQLSPNGWRQAKAPKGSYTSTKDLVAAWSKRFKGVKFKAGRYPKPEPNSIMINLSAAGVPEDLVEELKEHRQVKRLYWNSVVTTLAIGEEGATTKALGEEGGKVTTKALREEGATTLAIGEEGGRPRPSTRRLGEEGGRKPITQALKETGGKRRPGKLTTLALGEEGGRKRKR
ncbi:MAG: hypothetical protein ACE5KM_03415 [Planctomycetaceae bacterium]